MKIYKISSFKLRGWVAPNGEYISGAGSHRNILEKYYPDILPDEALQLGFLWVMEEDNILHIECNKDKQEFASRIGHDLARKYDCTELCIEAYNGQAPIRQFKK